MNILHVEQKHFFNTLLATSILGLSILACSFLSPASSHSPESSQDLKPSHYGVFFEKDGELIELQEQEIFDIPVENQMSNIQTISDSRPTFIVWRSNTNLDYLEFLKLNQYLGQSKQSISYNTMPIDDEIIEITANNIPTQLEATRFPDTPIPQTQQSPLSPDVLDEEASSFRDHAIQIVRDFSTLKFSMKEESAIQETSKIGNGTATRDATHFIYYRTDGSFYYETISANKQFCLKGGNGVWDCNPSENLDSPLLIIENILEGKPSYRPFDREVLSYGSRLDTYNGTACRTFFVESAYTQNITTITDIEEVCFDLKNYYPLLIRSKVTFVENGSITYEQTDELYDFEFNSQIDEIILPQ